MIRKGTIEDKQVIMSLIENAISDMDNKGINQWDKTYPNEKIIEEDILKEDLNIYEERGIIKGIIVLNEHQDIEYEQIKWSFCSGRQLIIHRLCIDPKFQRQGIARILMEYAEKYAKENKYDAIRLDAFPQNPRACNLYTRAGYKKVGVVTFRKGDFYCFEKQITNSDSYWDSVWTGEKIADYIKYINLDYPYKFIEIFKENNVRNVCDAACGFGKYSAICSKNNLEVSGFDISENAVNLTKGVLEKLQLKYSEFKICSMLNIVFEAESFDGVVAHAVLDHFKSDDAKKALSELLRITKTNGLIYLSFDGIEEDDLSLPHEVLEDGSFMYTDESRNGMIFKHYTNEDINRLIEGKEVLLFNTLKNGAREVIIRK